MSRSRLLAGACLGLACLLLAGYGHFVAVPRWPPADVGALCGFGGVVLLGVLVWRLMPAWWQEECAERTASPPYRRYARAMWPAMAAYVLILFGSLFALKLAGLPQWVRALVALAPVLPVAMVMRAMVRYLREIDELQRRIETEAICIAALAVPMAYFAGGFLQLAKVIDIPAGVAMIWVFPLTMFTYGVAKFAVSRHYR